MTFRTRLLVASLSTLAVGVGALLVLGNVFLGHQADQETHHLLRERAAGQVAALRVGARGVTVRESPNDDALDRRAWILDGDRVVERPAGVNSEVDRLAVRLGRAGRVVERRAAGDVALRAEPVYPDGASNPAGSVVVALSVESVEQLEAAVLIGSLVAGALVLIAG